MRINPVSFGSLQVFTLTSGKPKPPVPALVKLAFDRNPKLNGTEKPKGLKALFGIPAPKYRIVDGVDTFESEKTPHDGTVHEAFLQFARELDDVYKDKFKDPNDVFITKARFTKNPRETEIRYFLTASDYGKESDINKILNDEKGSLYSVSYSKLI